MSCMLALRQDRAPRPPCLVSNRDVKWHACRLLSCFCAPARPSLVFRSWVRCVWVWGWGSIARVTRLWLFLFQSLRPLVGLVSWFQRYQIINLSYLGARADGSSQDNVSYGWRLILISLRVVFSFGGSQLCMLAFCFQL